MISARDLLGFDRWSDFADQWWAIACVMPDLEKTEEHEALAERELPEPFPDDEQGDYEPEHVQLGWSSPWSFR